MDNILKVTVLTDLRSVTLTMPCDDDKIEALEDMGELDILRIDWEIDNLDLDDEADIMGALHRLNGIAEGADCLGDEDYKKFLAVCAFEHAFTLDDIEHCLDNVDDYDFDPDINSYEEYFEEYIQNTGDDIFIDTPEGCSNDVGKMILMAQNGSLTEYGIICGESNRLYDPLNSSAREQIMEYISAQMRCTISAADKSEEKLFYSCDDDGIKAARIGHLRLDFGSGKQFYGTWFESNAGLNGQAFKDDQNMVINSLRSTLLKDRDSMSDYIREHDSLDLGNRGNGFKVQTDSNVFYLRCFPKAGEYDCYCYCYDRELLEQAMGQSDDEDMAEEENSDITMGGMTQ